MTDERLHDLETVLTHEEIEELRNICYQHGNSWCPISDFFNDIERTKNANYNKNQAFKDLWLIINIILEKEKKLKALEIIIAKKVDMYRLSFCDCVGKYNARCKKTQSFLSQEEYDLLKEVGL